MEEVSLMSTSLPVEVAAEGASKAESKGEEREREEEPSAYVNEHEVALMQLSDEYRSLMEGAGTVCILLCSLSVSLMTLDFNFSQLRVS